jgi:hypothetical protein
MDSVENTAASRRMLVSDRGSGVARACAAACFELLYAVVMYRYVPYAKMGLLDLCLRTLLDDQPRKKRRRSAVTLGICFVELAPKFHALG